MLRGAQHNQYGDASQNDEQNTFPGIGIVMFFPTQLRYHAVLVTARQDGNNVHAEAEEQSGTRKRYFFQVFKGETGMLIIVLMFVRQMQFQQVVFLDERALAHNQIGEQTYHDADDKQPETEP